MVAETASVSSFSLAAPDGTSLPSALAGQYLTLRISPAGQPAAVRSYSLSAAPDLGRYRISVKREPNGIVSSYLHDALRTGATIEVAAPRGEFVLDDGAAPLVLISAGIGVTPVLSMLHDLVARRSQREVWWIHGARGSREHALAAEAHALLAELPNAHEHIFYSAATAHDRHAAHALPGRITERRAQPARRSARLQRLRLRTSCLHRRHRTRTRRHRSRQVAHPRRALRSASIDHSGHHRRLDARTPHQPEGPRGTGPLVVFARSGIETPFATSYTSLLELADACDISTRWSCRAGVCHTCVTHLVSGTISYQPAPLEPPIDGEVLICCARPNSDIVLDI